MRAADMGRIAFLLPLCTSFLVAVLLAMAPQMLELYVDLMAEPRLVHILAAVLALAGLLLVLQATYIALARGPIDTIYNDRNRGHNFIVDGRMHNWRDFYSFSFVVLPPVLGLIFGVASAWSNLRDRLDSAKSIAGVLGLDDTYSGLGRWATVSFNDAWLLGLAGLLGVAAIVGVPIVVHRNRFNPRFFTHFHVLLALVFAGAVVVPILAPLWAFDFGRAIGPLAMSLIVIILIYSFVAGCSLIFSRTGIPVLVLVVCWAVFAAWLADVPRTDTTVVNRTVEAAFRDWLSARRADVEAHWKSSRQFPVLIFASQGGGIYAASQSGLMFGRLQDRSPGFADKVFAISGVSGGSVGSSIFSALLQTTCADGGRTCTAAPGPRFGFERVIRDVVEADHLTPVAGTLFPDLVRTVIPDSVLRDTSVYNLNRAGALALSFERTFESASGIVPAMASAPAKCAIVKGTSAAAGPSLAKCYDEHWRVDRAAPALVLNTTSVESGYRTAFAPFNLQSARDGTLFAISDIGNPRSHKSHSIIEAAIASARFPGILSSMPLFSDDGRVNLVDGGYSDSSGSTTAVAIYNAIENFIDAEKGWDGRPLRGRIDLRVVLLVDAAHDQPSYNFGSEKISPLAEAAVPLTTVLKVRDTLATVAVTRARSRFAADPDHKPEEHNWKIQLVKLDHKTFRLPLAWKLSKFSIDLVALQIGKPELCREEPFGGRAELVATMEIIRNNSCVLKRIEELVQRRNLRPITYESVGVQPDSIIRLGGTRP
jgi:hypothetical protein